MKDRKRFELRAVEIEDCQLIFDWIKDESVSESAFKDNDISWKEHKDWFDSALEDESITIYIAQLKNSNVEIGNIRFEKTDSSAVVSVVVAREFRGEGYGRQLISAGSRKYLEDNEGVDELIAKIKSTNESSIYAFKKAGYVFVENTQIEGQDAVVYNYKGT